MNRVVKVLWRILSSITLSLLAIIGKAFLFTLYASLRLVEIVSRIFSSSIKELTK